MGPHLIADHAVHVNPSEIDKMAEYGIKVVHNPESNMKLSSGIAPVPRMIDRGINVGIGTDGGASNNNMDLFTEMDMGGQAPQGPDHGPHGHGCAHRTENGDHRRGQSVGALP